MAMIPCHRKNHRIIPKIWLMTDARIEDAVLLAAIARLPPGAGIVFRHQDQPRAERRALFDRVRAMARRHRQIVLLAGDARQALAWKADGSHGKARGAPARPMLHSAPAHGHREMRAAEAAGADIVFLSPLFPTRSHPGARALGRARFGLLLSQARRPVVALGGMSAKRAAALRGMGIYGWAAIDALTL
jgi:thiamine-phosphate pyrophosphorylase